MFLAFEAYSLRADTYNLHTICDTWAGCSAGYRGIVMESFACDIIISFLPLIIHCFTCSDLVVSSAFSLFQLDGLEKSFYSFYVCTAVRKFFFFLDPLRTGKKKTNERFWRLTTRLLRKMILILASDTYRWLRRNNLSTPNRTCLTLI